MTEEYEVTYTMRWPNSTITVGMKEIVTVEITEGMTEKDNHGIAADEVLKKRKGAEITSVAYR